MTKRDYRDYLKDIVDSIADIKSFVTGMTYKKFVADRKTVYAVTRGIEIIGEASKRIPKSLRDRNPSIPWKKVAGIRDIIAHEYFGIDLEIVWKVAREELPPLKPKIENILKSLSE